MIKNYLLPILLGMAIVLPFASSAQIVYSGTATLNSTQNITLDIFVDPTADTVQIIHKGPVNKWRGIGFGASSMPNTYAIITDGNGNIQERKLAGNSPGTVLTSSIISSSHSVAGMIATTTVTRSLTGLTADHYTFAGNAGSISVIWAYGNGISLAYHAGRGASTITLSQDCTNGTTANTISPVVCTSYLSNSGVTYDATGSYVETFTNSIGCDSLLTINLTVNGTSDSIQETVCSQYIAPSGAVYNVSGAYSDTVTNIAGCDSILFIDLEVLNTTSNIDLLACSPPAGVPSQSGNQTWFSPGVYTDTIANAAGCDSIMTVNLTFATASDTTINVTACESFVSNLGTVYSNSGTFTETYTSAEGCDSTVNFDLTIIDIDNSVNLTFDDPNFPNHIGEILTANQAGASYQWIDCDNNDSPIVGETNQSFAAATPGRYAVIITDGNCSDTSACQIVTLLSVNDHSLSSVSVFPNPTKGMVNFSIPSNSAVSTIEIFSISGQLVQSINVSNQTELAVELPEVQGIYFATMKTANGLSRTVKVVKY